MLALVLRSFSKTNEDVRMERCEKATESVFIFTVSVHPSTDTQTSRKRHTEQMKLELKMSTKLEMMNKNIFA